MLVNDLGCGVTLAVRTEAREGDFHGLMLRLLFALQEAGEDSAGGMRSYRAQEGITAGFAKSQNSLIFFCKVFQNGTNIIFGMPGTCKYVETYFFAFRITWRDHV